MFTLCTIVAVVVLSRYITVKSTDPLDRPYRGKRKTRRNKDDEDEDHDD